MSRIANAYATLVLIAVAFVAAVIASNTLLGGFRLDLTEDGLYTLSPGTRDLLAGVDEPINLYFFYSDEQAADVQFLRSYSTRVREMLEEFVAAAPGTLNLHEIDPAPFSEQADRAASFGLRDLTPSSEDSFYFGLAATNAVGEEAVIEVFEPSKEGSLEYDLARLVYSLSTSDKTVVGLLDQARMSGGFDARNQQPTRPWAVLQQMRQLFDVRTVEPTTTRIDPAIDVLWIVHPASLDEATLYAIDQFVLAGGRAVVFVDPHAEIVGATSGVPGADAPASSLEPLFSAWGLRFDPSRFVADDRYALQISTGQGRRPVRHAGLVGVTGDGLAAADLVTADLESVNLGTAGRIALAEDAPGTLEPLLRSSTEAALLDTSRLDALADPSALLDGFEPADERYVLAGRLSGTLSSAFPDGPPMDVLDAEADTASEPPAATDHIARTEDANLIVVGDVDVLSDRLWVEAQRSLLGRELMTAFANNGDFIGNAIANLGGSADLLGLRSRATFVRPFERVEALRREADARSRETEQRLERRLEETEQRLAELEQAREDSGSLLMTSEQQAELERFEQEQLEVRQELRAVRRDLDSSIERLGTVLKIINIAAVPSAVVIVALGIAALRRRRRARR